MSTWNIRTSWNSDTDGNRRFQVFKKENKGAIFKYNNKEAVVDDFATWGDIKKYFGLGKQANPDSANIDIWINGRLIPFGQIKRRSTRKAGTNAVKMEIFVGIVALMNIRSWHDFLSKSEDKAFINHMASKFPVVDAKTIRDIINLVQDNDSYADDFINVGSNTHKIIKNTANYKILDSKSWYDIKNYAVSIIDENVQGDKWNPADILFYREDFNPNTLKSFKDIVSLNEKFNKLIKSRVLVPISIKKTDNAIKGSRGITNQLNKNKKVNIADIIKNGFSHPSLKNIPVYVNYDPDKFSEDTTIQRLALGWINTMGKEHIEKTADIALGKASFSSDYYVVNNKTSFKVEANNATKSLLKSITISLKSKAIWLNFEDSFLIIRSKGSGIQMTADAPRDEKHVSPASKIKDTMSSEHLGLLESIDFMLRQNLL